VQLTLRRFTGGVAPKADVAQAQTSWTPRRARHRFNRQRRNSNTPCDSDRKAAPEFSLAAATDQQPTSPHFPVGLPSELLQRRPDIAAAERRVAEANQQIGIARAAYFLP